MSARRFVAATSAWSVSLSPSAEELAYVSDHDGWPRLTLCDRQGGHERTLDTGSDPVREAHWSPDGAWIAFLVAPGGSPRTSVWVIRPDGSGLRQLGGSPEGASYLGPWTHQPGVLALSHTTEPSAGVAELVNVETGQARQVASGGEPLLLDVDRQQRRALVRRGPRGARSLWLVDLASGLETELRWTDELGSSDLGRLSPDGSTVYVRSNAGRDLFALFAVSLIDNVPLPARLLSERADAELEDIVLSFDGATAALLWNRAGRSECELLQLDTGTLRELLLPEPVAHGGSFSTDGSWLAMTLEGPTHPRAVHVLDTTHGSWRRLSSQPSDWLQPTGTPTLERLRSSDGLEVSGWLYRPARTRTAPSAVLHLHGGPESQERPTYNPLFQALTEQGIAVFAPNVRGSSGFGRIFVDADNRERRWGAIADVAACAQYLFDQGLATPQTLACAGRSYGGYLTLAALVFHPELFAAGVDICGMADFFTFYRDTEPWIARAAYPKYGHPVHDAELLRQLSPLHYFDQLRAPLLVVHGENDSNVPLAEAYQVAAAARERGISVELLLFPDEGHELMQRKNRERFVSESVAWLARQLTTAKHEK